MPVDIKSARSVEHDDEQKAVEFSVDNSDRNQEGSLIPRQEAFLEMATASVTKPVDLAMPVVKDLNMENIETFQVNSVESMSLRESKQGKF